MENDYSVPGKVTTQADTKTKAITYSLLLIVATLLALMFRVPLEEELLTTFERPLIRTIVAGSFIRLIIITGLVFFIIKKRLLPFNGLYPSFALNNVFLFLILPVVIILLLAFSSYEHYFKAEAPIILLFGFDQALVGIMEELLFRGILLPLLILYFASRNNTILKATWLSALIFGAVHLVGLIRHPENIWGVTNTVIFAIGIGFLFACILFRTRNILVPIFLHFLVDFTNGANALSETTEAVNPIPTTSTIAVTLVAVTVMSLFFVGVGLLLLKRVNKEEWLKKTALIQI